MKSDLIGCMAICEAKDFYPELGQAIGMPCGKKKERNRLKRACFRLLMGNPARRSEKGQARWERGSPALADSRRRPGTDQGG